MKKMILVPAAIMLLAATLSCSSSPIVIKDDDFIQAKTVTMYLNPAITDWNGLILRVWENEFYREVKDGKSRPAVISFRIIGASLVEDLQRTMMIKVDDSMFNIVGTKVNDGNKGQEDAPSDFDVQRGKIFNLRITLSPQLEQTIASASSVTVRLYAGNKPITIVYSPKDVKNMKEFMSLDPYNPATRGKQNLPVKYHDRSASGTRR